MSSYLLLQPLGLLSHPYYYLHVLHHGWGRSGLSSEAPPYRVLSFAFAKSVSNRGPDWEMPV